MLANRWSLERLRLQSNYWSSCIILTAAHLDLFAWIGKREKSAEALTARFGGRPEAWEIFLNALCAIGILRKRGGKYHNTGFSSRTLSRGEATFLLPEYDDWKIWSGLASTLRTGKRPQIQRPFVSDYSKAKRLLRALQVDAQEIAPYLIAKLPLARSRTLLDIGGGLGAFSVAFCRRYPHLHATVVEHPPIVSLVRIALREAGLIKRIRVVGLDFVRDNLPQGFDAVFASNILHGHGVDENRSLLLKIRDGLNPKGQLILRDVFMRRDRMAPEWATLFSVSLLLHTPRGRCYALDEILGWLRESGFSLLKGPFRSSPLSFDPDSVLIAQRS
jgi:3-hydroxy-5-methyl-1-naphthoate 3-O-methyltransferase